jgi:hypothetical protein
MRAALLFALLAAAASAAADTYRWIDARGAVNYGSATPAGAREVRRLDEAAGRVSTIPAVPPAQLARERERLLEARIERLERELEAQRLQAAAPAPVVLVQPAPVIVAGPGFVPFFAAPGFGARFAHRPHFRASVGLSRR